MKYSGKGEHELTAWQVSVILCTSQAASDADETKHVLEFAAMAHEVKTVSAPLRKLEFLDNQAHGSP